MNFNLQKMPTKVKALLVAAIVYVLSMNIDAVQLKITPYLANHPKLTTWFAGIVFVIGLLQKPVVREAVAQVLDIQQTSPTEATVKVIPPDPSAPPKE